MLSMHADGRGSWVCCVVDMACMSDRARAPDMDPWTLAYLAGHRDMNVTKRYIHPQEHTILTAMEKVRGPESGHTFGHTEQLANPDISAEGMKKMLVS